MVGWCQATQEEFEEGGEDLPQNPGGVRDNDLPHVERRLAHSDGHVRPAHVEPGQD